MGLLNGLEDTIIPHFYESDYKHNSYHTTSIILKNTKKKSI